MGGWGRLGLVLGVWLVIINLIWYYTITYLLLLYIHTPGGRDI